jgi:hypothetical protein
MNPVLIFLPAIIVATALVVLGNEVTATALWRRRLTLFGGGLIFLYGLMWVASRTTTSTDWLLLQLLVLPYLLTGSTGLLMRSALHTSLGISRSTIVISLLLLCAVCFLIADFASYGLLAVVFAFLTAFATTIVAVIVGIWLRRALNGRRRGVALLVGIVFPIGLFLSVQIGGLVFTRRPDQAAWRTCDTGFRSISPECREVSFDFIRGCADVCNCCARGSNDARDRMAIHDYCQWIHTGILVLSRQDGV